MLPIHAWETAASHTNPWPLGLGESADRASGFTHSWKIPFPWDMKAPLSPQDPLGHAHEEEIATKRQSHLPCSLGVLHEMVPVYFNDFRSQLGLVNRLETRDLVSSLPRPSRLPRTCSLSLPLGLSLSICKMGDNTTCSANFTVCY